VGRRELGSVVDGIKTLFDGGATSTLSDGNLLERFLNDRGSVGEAAFAAIVERHGPMVHRVCRGVLRESHDADDAFQATFLILARKAGSIRRNGSVASWLYGVARRVALKARSARTRRAALELSAGAWNMEHQPETRDIEFQPEIQEEVDRLPPKYRAAVVLCDLEGLTHEEAAGELRIPVGTVKVRLARARQRLRGRLVRRGLAPVLLAAAGSSRGSACIPAPLLESITQAAMRIAAGEVAGASAPVAALVKGALRAMMLARLKTLVALVAASLPFVVATTWILCALPGPVRSSQVPEPKNAQTGKAQPEADLKPSPDSSIISVKVKKEDLPLFKKLPAAMEAGRSATIYAVVSGKAAEVAVKLGEPVQSGQLLVRISAPELEAELEESRAIVEKVQAHTLKTQAMLRLERVALEKARAKIGFAGDDAVKEATAKVEVAEAEVAEADAAVRVAREGVGKAMSRVALTRIVSPLDGAVARVVCNEGDVIRPGFESGSFELLTVMNTTRMRVVVDVPEALASVLKNTSNAKVKVLPLGLPPIEAKIARTAPVIEPNSHTMRAEIELDNADKALRPGQSVLVTLQVGEKQGVILLPESAVLSADPGKPFECYRVVDGLAKRTQIVLGGTYDGRDEILEGLKEGDVVVVNAHQITREGQPIRPAR